MLMLLWHRVESALKTLTHLYMVLLAESYTVRCGLDSEVTTSRLVLHATSCAQRQYRWPDKRLSLLKWPVHTYGATTTIAFMAVGHFGHGILTVLID